MIRKAILAVAVVAGLVGGIAFTDSTASADAIRIGRNRGVTVVGGGGVVYTTPGVYVQPAAVVVTPVCRTYEVRYLDCGVWRCYGTFTSEMRAIGVVEGLRFRGIQAMVEVR